MEEKRRYPRKKAEHLVFYFSMSELKEGLARSLNVSKAGVLLEMAEKLEPSAHIDLSISIGEDSIPLRGKVVWVKKEGGLYLVGVALEDLELPVETL